MFYYISFDKANYLFILLLTYLLIKSFILLFLSCLNLTINHKLHIFTITSFMFLIDYKIFTNLFITVGFRCNTNFII